jgi:HPt (histidine-containing phosphotransfer) domain-containing protein
VLAQGLNDVEQVKAAAETHDVEKLTRSAHGLKGVYATLRAEALRQVAIQLEEAGRKQDWEESRRIIEVLESSVHQLLAYIRNALTNL